MTKFSFGSKALLLTVPIMMSQFAFADSSLCVATPSKIRIVHVNGIATSITQAYDNLSSLTDAVGSSYNGQVVSYSLAYNYTDTVIADLLQSAAQVGLQFTSQVMQWMSGESGIPAWLQTILTNAAQGAYPLVASEAQDHVDKFRDAVLEGNTVLIVAHSQGNLYANEAYQMLQTQNPALPIATSVGVYSVATPANNVAGQPAPYTTNNRDFISLVPGALPANLTLTDTNTGLAVPALGLGTYTLIAAHSFIKTYLSYNYNARNTILAGINQSLSSLQKPIASTADGPMKFSLSWAGNADLDLSLFEPDGYYVSAGFASASGSLTFDVPKGHTGYIANDVWYGGVENYQTNCNQIQLGTYYIGARYYEDMQYTLPPTDPSCAAVHAQNPPSPLVGNLNEKSYCSSTPFSGVYALSTQPATLTISTPGQTQQFPLVFPQIDIDVSVGITPAAFLQTLLTGVAVTVTETTGYSDPNMNGKLSYQVAAASGQMKYPSALQAILPPGF